MLPEGYPARHKTRVVQLLAAALQVITNAGPRNEKGMKESAGDA